MGKEERLGERKRVRKGGIGRFEKQSDERGKVG